MSIEHVYHWKKNTSKDIYSLKNIRNMWLKLARFKNCFKNLIRWIECPHKSIPLIYILKVQETLKQFQLNQKNYSRSQRDKYCQSKTNSCFSLRFAFIFLILHLHKRKAIYNSPFPVKFFLPNLTFHKILILEFLWTHGSRFYENILTLASIILKKPHAFKYRI